jgi:hypothetical protein
MPNKQECNIESEKLQDFLEREAEEASRKSKFVQRASKVTGAIFAKTLILGLMQNPKATLNELIQSCDDLGVEISASGLNQRINAHAVGFLMMLFTRAVAHFRNLQPLPGKMLRQFSSIEILDSTVLTLPAAFSQWFAGSGTPGAEAGLKIHLCFDYLCGQFSALGLTEGKVPDQGYKLPIRIKANSLHLFDLGYFTFARFKALMDANAFFISRFKYNTRFFGDETAKTPIDILKKLQKISENRVDFNWFMGDTLRLPVRVLFERLPPKVVEERRRKAKDKATKKGRTCSKRYLALLEWSFLMTNVPATRLSFDQVFCLYRIRWHIELIFKLWKSQAKLAEVGELRFERVMCELFARLIGLVIFQWLVAPVRVTDDFELSFPKAFQILRRHAIRLLDSIAQGWTTTAQILADIAVAFTRFARKDKRNKNPSSYAQLLDCPSPDVDSCSASLYIINPEVKMVV